MVLSYRLTAARHCSRNARGVPRPARKAADTRAKDTGSGRLRCTEMLIEELEGPLPRLGSGGGILLQADRVNDWIIAGEGMSGAVAVEGVFYAVRPPFLFELV